MKVLRPRQPRASAATPAWVTSSHQEMLRLTRAGQPCPMARKELSDKAAQDEMSRLLSLGQWWAREEQLRSVSRLQVLSRNSSMFPQCCQQQISVQVAFKSFIGLVEEF